MKKLPNIHPGEVLLEEFLKPPGDQSKRTRTRRSRSTTPDQRNRTRQAQRHR